MASSINYPLLTVIVPCYNIEKYVDKCISSIVNQTYTNLEILLIDDGSTDNCGAICDEWQERDSRVRVIHKQNEGLAYARKTGVENATAAYITFVDGDDWIDHEMYATMMEALLSTGSDIAQCGVCMVYEEDGRMVHLDNEFKTGAFEIIGRIEGVLLILENKKWHSWMWNKIFKKHLFEGIIFPKGRGYGEDFIAHYLFHKANQSVFTSDEYCYYLQRTGSIVNTQNDVQKMITNHVDFFEACYDRFCFVEQHPEYHSALDNAKIWTLVLGICLLRNMIVYPHYFQSDYFYKTAKQLRPISVNNHLPLHRRLKTEFYLLNINPKLYKFFRTLYNQIIRLTNKIKITNKRRTDALLLKTGGSVWHYLHTGGVC